RRARCSSARATGYLARRLLRQASEAGALQLAGRHRVQQRAQLGAALLPKRRLEPGLGFEPAVNGGAEALSPGIGQANFAAAAVGAARDDRYKPLALERLQIPAERRAIHDEVGGERADRHRSETAQFRQDRELRRA